MSKRDDLELAAKAIGLVISWRFPVDSDLYPLKPNPDAPRVRHYPTFVDADGFSVEWNPEHDNGASFELAVALSMHVAVGDVGHPLSSSDATLPCGISATEPHNGNPKAATRLAVFRVAIEAGKRLSPR